MAAFTTTLSIAPQAAMTPRDTTLERLRESSMLLVVDNCEHLVDGESAYPVPTLDTATHGAALFVARADPSGGTVDDGIPLARSKRFGQRTRSRHAACWR